MTTLPLPQGSPVAQAPGAAGGLGTMNPQTLAILAGLAGPLMGGGGKVAPPPRPAALPAIQTRGINPGDFRGSITQGLMKR